MADGDTQNDADASAEDAATDQTTQSQQTRSKSTFRQLLKGPEQKFTGQQLDQRFSDYRTRRKQLRQARTPESISRSRRLIVSAVLGTAVVTTAVLWGLSSNAHQHHMADYQARITALEDELAASESSRDQLEDFDVEGSFDELMAAVTADASAVAQAQQGFAELYHQATVVEDDPQDGTPNDAAGASAEHREVLAPYFAESSYLVSDEEAYSWSTIMPFDVTEEIDPRFEWYIGYDDQGAFDPDDYDWQVEALTPDVSVTASSMPPDTAAVVWTNRHAETDEVLAWAQAQYSFDPEDNTGVFSSLEVVTTAAGAEHTYGSADDGEGTEESDIPDLEDLVNGDNDDESEHV